MLAIANTSDTYAIATSTMAKPCKAAFLRSTRGNHRLAAESIRRWPRPRRVGGAWAAVPRPRVAWPFCRGFHPRHILLLSIPRTEALGRAAFVRDGRVCDAEGIPGIHFQGQRHGSRRRRHHRR